MTDAETHERASRTHREAAERHVKAATYWDGQGDSETADLERRNAKIEMDAADLESDRAHLYRKRHA